MNELKRLVKLVVECSSKSSPFINYQDDDSLETKLFTLIKQNDILNDEDAAAALYQNKSSANYRMLKSRVRKKLLSQLHFIEFSPKKYGPARIEEFKMQTVILEAQALLTADEYKLADKLLTQALPVAKANHLTSSIVRVLEKKLLIYSNNIDKKAYQEVYEELQYYYTIQEHERKASHLFQVAHIELGASVNERNEYMSNIPEVLEKIHGLWLSSKSPGIYNLYHILSIHYLELQGNFSAISDSVAQAEQLVREGHIHPNRFNHKYNAYIRIYALLRTRQYDKGLKLAKDYLEAFEPNSINWFAFMENYLLLALHSKNYNLAGHLMQKSLSTPFINTIQNAAKERWELYRRYLLLMYNIMPNLQVVDLPKGVLAELVMLPKDKAGFNLSLLVLDIINSFLNQSIDDYEPQAERLRKYVSKYLRGEKAERPRLFLRLLLLVIKEDFHSVRAKEKGQKLYNKLSKATPPGDAFAEVEIVPYEHLWELVLKVLDKRSA